MKNKIEADDQITVSHSVLHDLLTDFAYSHFQSTLFYMVGYVDEALGEKSKLALELLEWFEGNAAADVCDEARADLEPSSIEMLKVIGFPIPDNDLCDACAACGGPLTVAA